MLPHYCPHSYPQKDFEVNFLAPITAPIATPKENLRYCRKKHSPPDLFANALRGHLRQSPSPEPFAGDTGRLHAPPLAGLAVLAGQARWCWLSRLAGCAGCVGWALLAGPAWLGWLCWLDRLAVPVDSIMNDSSLYHLNDVMGHFQNCGEISRLFLHLSLREYAHELI